MKIVFNLILAAFATFCVYLLFLAADFLFIDDMPGRAVIESRNHQDAWTEIRSTYNASTKSNDISTIYHAEEWGVTFKLQGEHSHLSCNEDMYQRAVHGTNVPVMYRRGRFTHNVYVTSANIP